MLSEGIVIDINKNLATVKVKRNSACGENCASCGGCDKKTVSVCAINEVGAKKDDAVLLESKTSSVLVSAFVVYIVPLIVFVLCYLFSAKLGEGIAAAFSVAMFFAAFYFIRLWYKKIPEVRIVRITESASEVNND